MLCKNQLNGMGYKLAADGNMGNETYAAVRDFQSRAGLPIDGVVGANTKVAMNEVQSGKRKLADAGQTNAPANVGGVVESRTNVPNNVAQFDRLTKTGQRNQMAHGRITVNGNTYDFRSGGGGRGNLPPGEYQVTRHLDRRSDKNSMMVDGVGYSFALSDKYDSRVGGERSLLRVHPDGGGPGTIGCIGVVGNGRVQEAFRKDMLAEISRNGGSYALKVQE
ncbi:MAG: peptidoglycan-binding protein [Deltaproteobacteria bacterium]|nr:peptidoglycan-binding protein [Deltaproteobacteria bacterium]